MAETFYALRYADGVPLSERKHRPTAGRHATFDSAAEAIDRVPRPGLMQIVERTVPAPPVVVSR